MVLVFIGSFRSTIIIALTIPLSALVAVIGLYFTGNTLNAMTLGGLALVMGRLVDDPIVDIENTFRHLDLGKSPIQAALDSAMEIAMPVLVATIATVAVFFPVVFLFGMGKYLFTPLALSVAFAMFASYFLSRTLSPAFCAYFLKPHRPGEHDFILFRAADWGFDRVRARYIALLRWAVGRRWLTVLASLGLVAASLPLYPFIIMFAVPLGIVGVLAILVATGTTLNVQSFMGVIFMIGIAVSNSILLVEFANRLCAERGLSAIECAVEAGSVRLRPIVMTSLAAIAGLIPLALHEGDATMPLARAVIGGLSASAVLTVFVVPCLYVIFKGGTQPRREPIASENVT